MDEHESADLRQTLTRAGRLKLFPIELQFVTLIAPGYRASWNIRCSVGCFCHLSRGFTVWAQPKKALWNLRACRPRAPKKKALSSVAICEWIQTRVLYLVYVPCKDLSWASCAFFISWFIRIASLDTGSDITEVLWHSVLVKETLNLNGTLSVLILYNKSCWLLSKRKYIHSHSSGASDVEWGTDSTVHGTHTHNARLLQR